MKKFLDTFILKNIWRQLFLALLFGFIVVILATPIAQLFLDPKSLYSTFHSSWLWSLLHLCDGGSIAATITAAHASSDEVAGNVALFSAFIVWFVGAILFCFITGAISNAFEVRKEKIASGLVRYKFTGGHGIIIGWDFQGLAIVMAMRELFNCKEIVILSSQSAEDIRSELENISTEKEMKNIFIHKGNVFDKNELKQLFPYEAECIFILGDQNENNNDGGNAKIRTLLPTLSKSQREKEWKRKIKVPCFIDISSPYNLPAEGFDIHSQRSKIYDYRVFNFYKQSANELLGSMFSIYCFNKGNRKGVYEYEYSPLAYRRNPEASHVHLMVTGFDNMAHMYIIQAIKTLQPSKEPHKISIFSDDVESVTKFFDYYDFDALQNVKIKHYLGTVCSRDNRELVKSIVQDLSASVSLLIADPQPSKALEVFHSLPSELNFENIRIIIEQQLMTANTRGTYTLRRKGYSSVDYIGLLDKFYYSLLKQEEFVDKFVKLSANNQINNTSQLRESRRCFADTILEKLYGLDLKFDEIVDEKCTVPHITALNTDMEQLAMADHMNYVNNKILTGYKYDVQNDDRHFFNSLIKPWGELSEEEKEIFRSKVSTILPAIGEMFGKTNGEYKPFGVFNHQFRYVCGFADNSEKKINWTIGDSANNLYQNVIDQLRRFNVSTIYTNRILEQSQKHDRYKSLAVLCTLEDNGNSMFLDMACREKIPVIAILPMPPEKYQYNFAEGFCRNEFWRRLRNVYTYYVVPEEIKNKEEYINEIISKYSDEIWHIGQYERPNDTGAEIKDVKYIKKCSEEPLLREIKMADVIIRDETQVLFPAYYEKEKKPVKKNAKMVIKKFLTRIIALKR